MEPLALVDCRLARSDLDSRRTRSDARRVVRRNPDANRDSRFDRLGSWRERDLLSRGRGHRRPTLWLRNGSIWPKEIIFHHCRRLSHWNRALGFLMESCELRDLPRAHRRGHRRRIRGDQFGDRRTDSRARARTGRFDDQRIVLDWRRARFRSNTVPSRSATVSNLVRLAFCLRDRRGARSDRDFLSTLDSRKPALADDSRSKRRGRRNCRSSRAEIRFRNIAGA